MIQDSGIASLLRKNIRLLKPYASARNEYSGDARIFLDANENYRGFTSHQVNRYPDPLQRELKEKLAALRGCTPHQIFLGNGSDEAIDLIIRAFAEPGSDKAVIMPPTYGVYQVFADLNDIETIRMPLQEDFSLDLEGLSILFEHRDFAGDLKLLFVCSPNNPTGNAFPHGDILRLVNSFPGIVVIDEAYQDFHDGPSNLSLIEKYSNVIVLQTFSKAWGMAGARVGMAYGSPEIIRVLNTIKYPYNVSVLSQQAALEALDHAEEVVREIDVIREAREKLSRSLAELPYVEKVYPSEANFLLVKTIHAAGLCSSLKQQGIIIRNREHEYRCSGCVRITVGSSEENRMLLDALQSITLEKERT